MGTFEAKPILTETQAKEPLADAANLVGITLGLATGALVFGVGLLTTASNSLGLLPRYFLIASWLFLAFSIVTGVRVRSQIPVKLRKRDYDINSAAFRGEGSLHALSFILGAVSLGFALFFTLIGIPIQRVAAVENPREAYDRAKTELTKDERFRLSKIESIELINGAEGTAMPNGAWHVRFDLRSRSFSENQQLAKVATIDVIVPVRNDGPLRRIP